MRLALGVLALLSVSTAAAAGWLWHRVDVAESAADDLRREVAVQSHVIDAVRSDLDDEVELQKRRIDVVRLFGSIRGRSQAGTQNSDRERQRLFIPDDKGAEALDLAHTNNFRLQELEREAYYNKLKASSAPPVALGDPNFFRRQQKEHDALSAEMDAVQQKRDIDQLKNRALNEDIEREIVKARRRPL